MKRRSALKTISLGAGYTMTGLGFTAFISGCKQDASPSNITEIWSPSFLSKPESKIIGKLLEAMLPSSASSPGADELNLVQTIDNVVNKIYKKEDQTEFKLGLAQLVNKLKQISGLNGSDSAEVLLDKIQPEHVNSFMKKYMTPRTSDPMKKFDIIKNKKKKDLEEGEKADFYLGNFIDDFRSLGINSYYSHQTIGTEHLNYDPVPGQYNGCMPLSEIGNSWSAL